MDRRAMVTERGSDKINERACTGEIRIGRQRERERETERQTTTSNGKHLPTR